MPKRRDAPDEEDLLSSGQVSPICEQQTNHIIILID